MLHQWFTCVHLLDTYLANLKEGFQLSFHYPSVSIRAAQSGLQSVPAYRMRWGCHHLFRSYDGNPSNIANIRLHSVSGHTIFCKARKNLISHQIFNKKSYGFLLYFTSQGLHSLLLPTSIPCNYSASLLKTLKRKALKYESSFVSS